MATGWASLESLLESAVPNTQAYRPNLDHLNGFAAQATQLASILGPTDTLGVAVAHSAGGIASRKLARATNGRLRGVLTVGSPLQGAAIAKNSALGLSLFAQWINAIMYPINTYYMEGAAEWVVNGSAVAAYLNYVREQIPVLNSVTAQQLAKGSSYIATLNAPTNMLREVSSGLKRLAIVNESDPWDQLCRNTESGLTIDESAGTNCR